MLESVTYVIRVALTPIFLLSAITALMHVFSMRLGRVADRVDLLSPRVDAADPDEARHLAAQLAYLRRRSAILDVAVVLAATGGGFTCVAALILFIGALRESTVSTILFAAFGMAISCAMAAIICFVVELLVAGRGVREEVEVRHDEAVTQLMQPGEFGRRA